MASAFSLIPAALATLAWSGAGRAQESPNSFQLPSPTPTPTPAPQGPVDVRSGVPIGPRTIRAEPSPTPTPTQAPTQAPAATPAPTTSDPQSATSTPSASTRATVPRGERATPAASRRSGAQSNAAIQSEQAANGAQDTTEAIGADNEAATGAVTDQISTRGTPGGDLAGDEPDTAVAPSPDEETASSSGGFNIGEYWPWIGGLAGLLILLLGGFLWRKRRVATPPVRIEPPRSDSGEPSISETVVVSDRPNLTLDITSATRSFMMFTVEFRVTLANRTDRAMRDLNLSAQLVSAQRSATNAPPAGGGQPVGTIERIGPHQSRSISGKIQLPMSQVEPLRQGKKPLLVPLLQLTVEGAGQPASSRSYVLGLPSATAQGRVHPIPLDVPPGGLPDLKAREIAVSDGPAQPEPEAA